MERQQNLITVITPSTRRRPQALSSRGTHLHCPAIFPLQRDLSRKLAAPSCGIRDTERTIC